MTYYAVVFKKEFEPGDHWDINAPADDSDRRQHWKKGDLYSLGSVLPAKLPFHLEAIPIAGPPESGDTWDVAGRRFVKWHENKALVQSQIDAHQAEIDRLKRHL